MFSNFRKFSIYLLSLVFFVNLAECTEKKDDDKNKIIALAAVASASAAPTSVSSTSLTAAQIQEILAKHNEYRKATSSTIPDLKWSDKIAAYAQTWANYLRDSQNCGLVHRSGSTATESYGENLYAIYGATSTGTNVTKAWYDEVSFYTYSSNTCQSGKVCGHYTQVVWKNSTELGCGKATCTSRSGEVWVCNYSPAGNFVGQKPY